MKRLGLVGFLVLLVGCPRPRVSPPPPPHPEPEPPHTASSCPVGQQANGTTCGIEWWPIKVGCDAEAPAVDLTAPTPTTIAELHSLPKPEHLRHHRPRMQPVETTFFRLTDVVLVEARHEEDSDYHLVVADPADPALTMVVEIPALECMPEDAWRERVARARASFIERQGQNGSHTSSDVITVEGIGFFDRNHGQRGVAPNGIELHPVLGICFGPGCDPSR